MSCGLYVGDIVWYYPGGESDKKPVPAIVQSIGVGSSLHLSVMGGDRRILGSADGVKHKDDADLRTDEILELGVWDYHPRFPAIRETKEVKVENKK